MVSVQTLILTLGFGFSMIRVTTGQCNEKKVIDLANSTSGSIYKVNFSSSNGEGYLYCLWRLEAPVGQRVLIFFTSIDLGTRSCTTASLEILEESGYREREILADLCNSAPHPVISSGRFLEVKFHSWRFAKGRGFVAHYEAVNSSSGCDGSLKYIDLSYSRNGSIYSPNYPSTYGADQDCKWRIRADAILHEPKVLIYFTSFDLGAYCCNCDYVEIFDGSSEYYNLLARVCGNSLPPPVYSSRRYIFLKFRSNSSVQGRGFIAHYRKLLEFSGCPSIDPGALTDVIYNSRFGHDYSVGSCSWDIAVPAGMMINLTFVQFDLVPRYIWDNEFCPNYVEVRDNNSYRRKLCGSLAPFSMFFFGSISVTFHSSSSGSGGFLAYYQIVASSLHTTPYNLQHSTPKPTLATPAPSSDACRPYSRNKINVGGSSSLSIASPTYQRSPEMTTTCSWQISTTEGYILQLVFDNLTISKCDKTCCTYRYIQARDGNGLSDPLLGTYCNGNYPSLVSTKGNQMFIKYYGRHSNDTFYATVLSKKGDRSVGVTVIVVPIVAVIVIIAIIISVIVIKKRRSSREAESSSANTAPVQPLPESAEVAPLFSQQDPPHSPTFSAVGSVQL